MTDTNSAGGTGQPDRLTVTEGDFTFPAEEPAGVPDSPHSGAPNAGEPEAAPGQPTSEPLEFTPEDFQSPPAPGEPKPAVTQEDIQESFEVHRQDRVMEEVRRNAEPMRVDERDFDVQPKPEAPPPRMPVTATVAPATGLSAFAKLIKLLLIAIFTGAIGTAGFYTVRHFGLFGDSPSAVVQKYYERLHAGGDVSDLLSTKSRELYSQMGFDDSDMRGWITAVSQVYAHQCTWRVTSEKIEGDRAWVLVTMETDDPVQTRLNALEAEIKMKNEYNRRQGNSGLIALNNAHLAKQKQMLSTPFGRRIAEAMRRTETPHLCVRDGGRWKVAPAEQMDAALSNVDKALEGILGGKENRP